MLFMGQEWAASTPFIFFTDHNEELGKLITKGRREEFKDFSAFHSEAARARIPDPQDPKSFLDSKLVWDELGDEKKSRTLELYRKCLALRRREAAFRPESRETWYVEALEMGVGALRFKGAGVRLAAALRSRGRTQRLAGGRVDLQAARPARAGRSSSRRTRSSLAGRAPCAFDPATNQARFNQPELVILRS